MNERITEEIVRETLKGHKRSYEQAHGKGRIVIEEQRSSNEIVRRALRRASKSRAGGGGKPGVHHHVHKIAGSFDHSRV